MQLFLTCTSQLLKQHESLLVLHHDQPYTVVHTASNKHSEDPLHVSCLFDLTTVQCCYHWHGDKVSPQLFQSLYVSINSYNSRELLLQVRNKLVPAKRRAEAGQGTTWRALPQEDLKARLAASAVRRRAMTQAMPKDQWDLEKKYASYHVTLESCLAWPLHAWCSVTIIWLVTAWAVCRRRQGCKHM